MPGAEALRLVFIGDFNRRVVGGADDRKNVPSSKIVKSQVLMTYCQWPCCCQCQMKLFLPQFGACHQTFNGRRCKERKGVWVKYIKQILSFHVRSL